MNHLASDPCGPIPWSAWSPGYPGCSPRSRDSFVASGAPVLLARQSLAAQNRIDKHLNGSYEAPPSAHGQVRSWSPPLRALRTPRAASKPQNGSWIQLLECGSSEIRLDFHARRSDGLDEALCSSHFTFSESHFKRWMGHRCPPGRMSRLHSCLHSDGSIGDAM